MRRFVVPAVIVACVLALVGCGRGDAAPPAPRTGSVSPSPLPSGAYNGTDVMFLQMMVPHHGQGVEIARLAATRAVRPEVKTLAAAIVSTQASEIEQMSGWLREWGQPATGDANAHAEHGGMPQTSAAEIARLKAASGAKFERDFLNTLIAHQDDAIQLARMETGGGANPRAKELADQIQKSRAAQIRMMLEFLRTP